MTTETFKTRSGQMVTLRSREVPMEGALDPIYGEIDTHRGAVFSSGFDYPGRHSRWEIGFVNPALEFIVNGRSFTLNALNQRGEALVKMLAAPLRDCPAIAELSATPRAINGVIAAAPEYFPEEERSRQPSVFSVLRVICDYFGSTDPAASHLGLYGAFGYDLVFGFENIRTRLKREGKTNDCHLFLPLELTVVDRKKEVAAEITYSINTPDGASSELNGGGESFKSVSPSGTLEIQSDHKPGEFAEKVKQVIEGTRRGDYFEVVLSQTFSSRFTGTSTELFKRLARINPSPYMFLLNFGTEQLVGASPEIYVRVTGKRYETCPIAGTVRRGETAIEDADRVLQLLTSNKDESELTMCTDVDRNDMARVCEPGSVRVIGRRQVELYSHLIHTVDHLEGTLAEGFDGLDAFQTHMWACTVTGAPKPAALQTIEDLENTPRGWYSGAIGMISFDGSINTGITLRTAQLKDGRATTRAGATLLFESDPATEEEETRIKAAAFLAALVEGNAQAPKPATSTAVGLAKGQKILLVDYQDSFVHNLAAYLRELGARVTTLRHGFPEEMLDQIAPDLVLLSPGPGSPEEFGIPDFIGRLVERKFPIFGVCLGHQAIGLHFGGKLGILPKPCHGKASSVHHFGSPFFEGIDETFQAGRYHSLYIKNDSCPASLEVIARVKQGETEGDLEDVIMAVKHKTLPIAGVQFHPESLMSLKKKAGHQLLTNVLKYLR